MKGYSQSMEYLSSLEGSGIIFGLENIERILESIENPHKKIKCVHVGGTNGKGSVSTMLSCILKRAGYRVGKYTSPHLIRFNERIALDEKDIEDESLPEIIDFIRGRIEDRYLKRQFSYFDFTTAIAFEYFYRKNVDIAILEVGLGGRLDSTNIVSPLISIITNIEFDHQQYLGYNLEAIAKEKSGIIKEHTPVITGADGDAIGVIHEVAEKKLSPLYILGRDFFYEKDREQVMTYKGIGNTFQDMYINLRGDHQLKNASLALCAAEFLIGYGYEIPQRAIYDALADIAWQGRLELLQARPVTIIDGAHNHNAAVALSQFIKTHYNSARKILIFGVMADKDYEDMLRELIPVMDVVIFTKPHTDRALSPYRMAHLLEDCIITDDVRTALVKAKTIAGDDDLILITGSLYTAGEAKKIFHEVF